MSDQMKRVTPIPPAHDPIAANLSPADDRVLLSHWLPPRFGVVPRIRIGRHWINVLWALPVAFVLLVIAIAIAQALREVPAVQDFLVRYPALRRRRGTSMLVSRSGFECSIF